MSADYPHQKAAQLAHTNKNWAKRHGYPHRYINTATQLLYGKPLNETIQQLHAAHMTPWGNTPHGARKELTRTLENIDQIAAVIHTLDM
jgi:hypothetical protein